MHIQHTVFFLRNGNNRSKWGYNNANADTTPPTLTPTPRWEISIVDNNGYNGTYNSLALNSGGNPCISYYGSVESALRYTRWTGSDWQLETVDNSASVGRFTSLAINNDDHPCISYWDETYSDLKYAEYTGSMWSIETVDTTGETGKHTSLRLDGSDNPCISY